jgi:cytochrome P450
MTRVSGSAVPVRDAAVDPGDPVFWAGDPHPALDRLRAEGPVVWVDSAEAPFWAVTRHAEVVEISRHPERFRSGDGVLLVDRLREVAGSDSLLYLDPPIHGERRRLASPSLTVRRVAALEEQVRARAVALLDGIAAPGEPIDAVDELCAPLPMLVIADLLGVADSDMADFRRWSDAAIAAGGASPTAEELASAGELFSFLRGAVARRRAHPTDDLLSVVVTSEVDGERLGELDAVMFGFTLLVAGNETTRNLLSNGLVALAEHPDQRAALVGADDATLTTAVDELLRWEPPIVVMGRTAVADEAIGGVDVEDGQYLALLYPSATRDESVFGPTATSLDLTRDPNPHLAFGVGEHFCLGAGLARLEGRVLLGELLARWPRYEVAGPPVRVPSTLVRGIEALPVVLSA